MAYSHEQPSKAYISMYVSGIIGLVMVIVFNVVGGVTQNYWMFGVAGGFYWMLGFLGYAKYYTKLTVKDEDDQRLYVRFADPAMDTDACNSCCIPPTSLIRGVKIPYANIKSYSIVDSDSCDSTTDQYNCCSKRIIYNADAFECGKVKLIELKLKEAISFNECCCKCCGCECAIVQVSSDDLDGLEAWLKQKGVSDGNDAAEKLI